MGSNYIFFVMDVGDIIFLSFHFLFTITTFLCHPPLLFVSNQNNIMFLHNMFFHNNDAMCRVVRKHTFLGSHNVIVTCSLTCGVTHDTPHHLNNLNVDYCIWIIEQEECPSGGGSMMQKPRLLVLL
jgi:hypothetical protein